MTNEIKQCRICENKNLVPVLNLGDQVLTGVFPKTKTQKITSGPLELIKCQDERKSRHCGLLQLRHSYDSNEMYGHGYGYRSSLNQSMVVHLQKIVNKILDTIVLSPQDLIIDIGSNDATLLKNYSLPGLTLAGVDPAGKGFSRYYPRHIKLIPDFFSAKVIHKHFGNKKAKVVTSVAMLYDLKNPMDFMRQVHDILDDKGIWVFEQSYLPTMLAMNAYDTICHEHLEYYALKQIKWMTDRVGFKMIDIQLNAVNGGSFAVTVAKKSNKDFQENRSQINRLLSQEEKLKLSALKPYQIFEKNIFRHRDNLWKFIETIKFQRKTIFGYGASTKGNVILQFCKLTFKELPFIADVNEDKFGSFTPGSGIPIISEEKAKARQPDYFLVLPWHFRPNILAREKAFLAMGGSLVFPLPEIETVTQ